MKQTTIRKSVSIVLILMMVMSTVAMGFAEDGAEEPAKDKAKTEEPAEKEKPAEKEEPKEEKPAAEEPKQEPKQEEPVAAEKKEKPKQEKQEKKDKQAEKDRAEKKDAVKEDDSDARADNAKKKAKDKKEEPKELKAGVYAIPAKDFSYSGGDGRITWTCAKVYYRGGKAVAMLKTSSDSITQVYPEASLGETDRPYYDCGNWRADVYSLRDKAVCIPVVLNDGNGRFTARTKEGKWIQFTYHIKLEAGSEPTGEEPVAPGAYSRRGEKADNAKLDTNTKITFKKNINKKTDTAKSEQVSVTSTPQETSKTQASASATDDADADLNVEEPADSQAEEEASIEQPSWEASLVKQGKFMAGQMADGTYTVTSEITTGSGRSGWECTQVIMKDGVAYGVFTCSSAAVTHIYMGKVTSDADDPALYNAQTGKCGQDVYRVRDKKAYVKVKLNEQSDFATRTYANSQGVWVAGTYKINLAESAQPTSSNAEIPAAYQTQDGIVDNSDEGTEVPSGSTKLSDGTYKIKAKIIGNMMNLKSGEDIILVKKGSSMTATFALNGSGYDMVYMGTPAQAKAAGSSKWSKAKIVNGVYTFTVPVSALDTRLTISPRSSRYESQYPQNNPNDEHFAWRPDKYIIFYSSGAVKVKDGTTVTPTKPSNSSGKNGGYATSGTQGKIKLTDKTKDKVSKWKDDSGKSTSAVNNKTSLKDGVYAPDRFSWSGGSGRLAWIKCTKITVTGGKAYATIVFGSTKFDNLKASGKVFSKSGGGHSTFTIPIKLNANNTIIGRTTAMSMPHWVKYNIFVYKKGASGKGGTGTGDDGHLTNTRKLSDKAPDLLGLKVKKSKDVEKAEYFKIFRYEKGITLISIDQARGTALYKEEKKDEKKSGAEADAEKKEDDSEANIEYDEEGKPIAKSQNMITEELYQNNVVNYLIVPKGVEIPAGLDKDCIIIQQPKKSAYVFDENALEDIIRLKQLDKVTLLGMEEKDVKGAAKKALDDGKLKIAGDITKPDYAEMVREKTDLVLLPGSVLPEKVKKVEKKGLFGGNDEEAQEEAQEESDQKAQDLATMQRRFASLSVPMLVSRADAEKTNYAEAEWIKVYGAIYGQDAQAKKIYDKYVKANKEKKLKGENNDEK